MMNTASRLNTLRKEIPLMVFNISLQDIANAVDGVLIGENCMAHGVSTDTRTLMRSDLFIALRGDNYDGHTFIDSAMNRGACAYLVDKTIPGIEPLIVVNDTRIALGKLASFWRRQFSIPVIAITGSNGKTTVKEMIAAIFSQHAEVLYTHGNFNNDIGLPLTLLSLNSHHEYAVIEMGANHMQEIAWLTEITNPDTAIITNAGPAHLEGFGSIDNVAQAKGELFAGIKSESISVINNDDVYSQLWKDKTNSKHIISFGATSEANVYFSNLGHDDNNYFDVHFPDGKQITVTLNLLGVHNVLNATAAAAVAYANGIDSKTIKNGLEAMQPVTGRLMKVSGMNGSTIIDDTYNANPASVKAALNVLKHCKGKRIFILGDLGELGSDSVRLHEEIAIAANQNDVDVLFTVGDIAKHTARLFAGTSKSFDTVEDLISEFKGFVEAGNFVLVKGSRFMRMERVVDSLIQKEANQE